MPRLAKPVHTRVDTRCHGANAQLPQPVLLTALAPSFAVRADDYNEAFLQLRIKRRGRIKGYIRAEYVSMHE